tara:strand:- start:274 stop:1269 length:996 start_codon:yes stop_codon:yes gene_type:complete
MKHSEIVSKPAFIRMLRNFTFFIVALNFLFAQKPSINIKEIETQWKVYTSFQKEELLNFCEFLFDEGYYERAVLAYFRYAFRYPEDPLISVIYYKIARSYEEMGNNELALEYYGRVQSFVKRNSSEFKATIYRITYVHLKNGNYQDIYDTASDSLDPYLKVFEGYAYLSELKWENAKNSFSSAMYFFDTDEYNDQLKSLIRVCKNVKNLPMKNRSMTLLASIFPGGGRFYHQDWYAAGGTLFTTLGAGIQLATGGSMFGTIVGGLTLAGMYGTSIWGSVKDVDYANTQMMKVYAKRIKLKYSPKEFIDFREPEYLVFEKRKQWPPNKIIER